MGDNPIKPDTNSNYKRVSSRIYSGSEIKASNDKKLQFPLAENYKLNIMRHLTF